MSMGSFLPLRKVLLKRDGLVVIPRFRQQFFNCAIGGKTICSWLMSVSQSQDRIRCFIAIPVDPGVLEIVRQLQSSLDALPAGALVRWTRPEQVHLTLKFLGDVPVSSVEELISAVQQACEGVGPFNLRLANLGCFPNSRFPRIVWVGLAGDLGTLMKLQDRVSQRMAAFGAHEDNHPFHPHLSLGRVKRADREMASLLGKGIAEAENPEPVEWTVGQVELIRSVLGSHGSTYSNLTVVLLAAR
jgi:2'-5' RNA ligase